jgi:hypothetical protein
MKNLTREELFEAAETAIALAERGGGKAFVFFKWTCEKCGTRVTFKERNVLWENGECCQCGHVQPVTEGGFALHVDLARTSLSRN